uniref:Isocitrate dehydrogenase (NAD(+)) 3 non-catalytic subunit gamma n=1 Tax=Taeniopygia guttata TaxID=59729 RepID=A0A674HSF7_TAEGU
RTPRASTAPWSTRCAPKTPKNTPKYTPKTPQKIPQNQPRNTPKISPKIPQNILIVRENTEGEYSSLEHEVCPKTAKNSPKNTPKTPQKIPQNTQKNTPKIPKYTQNILIVRENTEGEYSSLEHESVAGVVESLKIITAGRSRRIAHYAFGLARAAARRSVTAVHKANIMKLGDGLFLQCCREVAAEYPEITFRSMIVDNTTMQLVSRPQQFDVMVMPNLYGNIVNNVCAGLVGGPGLVPGANYGHDYAVFETATRNTGKSIANRNIANPTAALLAACMMLDHLRLHGHASTIRQAVLASLDDPRTHTPDIGGQGTTSGAVQSIIGHLPRG